MNFRRVIDFHVKNNADITVAAVPVPAAAASGLGIMKIRQDGRILTFSEKPAPEDLPELRYAERADGCDYLASMGIYVFSKSFLVDLLTDSAAADFGKDLIPQTVNKHKLWTYIYDGYWEDIGSIERFTKQTLPSQKPSRSSTSMTCHAYLYASQKPARI